MKKITQEQLKQIDNFLQDIPTKYGVPLIQFLNNLEDIEEPKEEEKDKKTK